MWREGLEPLRPTTSGTSLCAMSWRLRPCLVWEVLQEQVVMPQRVQVWAQRPEGMTLQFWAASQASSFCGRG